MKMFENLFSLVLFSFLLMTGAPQAQSLEITPINCTKNLTKAEKYICLVPEVSDMDALNNRIYKSILKEWTLTYKKSNPQKLSKLTKQLNLFIKNWIAYRDTICELRSSHIQDTEEQEEIYTECLIAMITSQAEELRLLQINSKFQ